MVVNHQPCQPVGRIIHSVMHDSSLAHPRGLLNINQGSIPHIDHPDKREESISRSSRHGNDGSAATNSLDCGGRSKIVDNMFPQSSLHRRWPLHQLQELVRSDGASCRILHCLPATRPSNRRSPNPGICQLLRRWNFQCHLRTHDGLDSCAYTIEVCLAGSNEDSKGGYTRPPMPQAESNF